MTETNEAETILGALRERRSRGMVTADPVPRVLIERLIEAATWAPNHKLTEPWRFVVVAGAARAALGDVMAHSLRGKLENPEDERGAAQVAKERHKPLRAPVVIAVAAVPSPDPGVVEVEEVAAVAAGVQNILLAAEALGLGAIWRTGAPAYDPAVKRFLGLPDRAALVAFVYLGYPQTMPPRERRSDARAYTTWLGWEDSLPGG